MSFSLCTVNNISDKGLIELSKALKSCTSLTSLGLASNKVCLFAFSLNTANQIGTEGALKLYEALKANSSMTKLNLSSNILIE
jgi:hypothetical protein